MSTRGQDIRWDSLEAVVAMVSQHHQHPMHGSGCIPQLLLWSPYILHCLQDIWCLRQSFSPQGFWIHLAPAFFHFPAVLHAIAWIIHYHLWDSRRSAFCTCPYLAAGLCMHNSFLHGAIWDGISSGITESKILPVWALMFDQVGMPDWSVMRPKDVGMWARKLTVFEAFWGTGSWPIASCMTQSCWRAMNSSMPKASCSVRMAGSHLEERQASPSFVGTVK